MGKKDTVSDFPYPEMREYPWVKDLERVKKEFKFVTVKGILSELPKAPINLVLTVMREAASRPEIMAAFASTPLDGQIPEEEFKILRVYRQYLLHKYGNNPDPVILMMIPMRKLANGQYKDLDDPSLIADLMSNPRIRGDNGRDYS